MMRALPLTIGSILLLASGVVHGLWTDRWGIPVDVEAGASRLGQAPLVVGDWEGTTGEVNADELAKSGLVGHLMRRYVHRRDGREVLVFIGCGRPGHVSVHTPDVCYAGAGFEAETKPVKFTLDGDPQADLWTSRFAKTGPTGSEQLRMFWTWNAGGRWQAANNARLTFARYPVLYKMYVFHAVGGREGPLDKDPCAEFLREFLPALDRCLGIS